MSDNDRTMRWKIKRKFISVREMMGLLNNGTADASLSEGNSVLAASGALMEIGTMVMTTADEVHHVMPIPWDLNRSQKVAGRILFAADEAVAADKPEFIIGSVFFAKQAALVELKGGAEAAVDCIHDGTVATDNSFEATPWVDLEWDQYISSSDILVGISIELNALGGATADATELIGLELAYVVEATAWESRVDPIGNLIGNNSA